MTNIKKSLASLLMFTLVFSVTFGLDYTPQADKLNALGLFKGGSSGYELDRAPTRAEGAVMLLRLLGKESESLLMNYSHPFTDVPAWASPYIGYMYQKGLTTGVSPTRFDAASPMNGKAYATFVLRALGYDDKMGDFSYDTALDFAVSKRVITASEKATMEKSFLRNHMVGVSFGALNAQLKNSTSLLGDYLISQGVISGAKAKASGISFSLPASSLSQTKLPSAIWKLYDQEASLKNSGDLKAQIANWQAIVALFDAWDDDNDYKLNNITPRLNKIAEAYEKLYDYDKAIHYLKAYSFYASVLENQGKWDQFARLGAESKIVNLQADTDLYLQVADTAAVPYFGAKHEPKSGLYFGAVYDNDPRIKGYDLSDIQAYFSKRNSVYPFYLEFGHNIADYDRFYQAAQASGTGISLAWNAYQTYSDLAVHRAYIETTAKYLGKLSVPVFVRYGSEFNIAEGFESASQYVANYKYVANILRQHAPNVALVWSPNEITESTRNLMDYYPGDDYVDWVGLSTYTYYYFGDKTDWGSQQASIDNQFFTGSKANPLSKVKQVVELFEGRKPIMISENGVSHYSKVAGEDMTDWALVQLRRAYEYIPLKYPSVKAIFYFNVDSIATKKQTYAFYLNPSIELAYEDIVGQDHYLPTMTTAHNKAYTKVDKASASVNTSDTLKFKSLVNIPDQLKPKVVYSLNGKQVKTTTTIPYDLNLTSSQLTSGQNALKVDIYLENGQLFKSTTYTLDKNNTNQLVRVGKQ